MQNKLNNMPKIHSKMSNYELYLELGSNESAFNIIKMEHIGLIKHFN